jgi:hypothetical protein
MTTLEVISNTTDRPTLYCNNEIFAIIKNNIIKRTEIILHQNVSSLTKHIWNKQKLWSSESSGICCRVVKQMSTDVSEMRTASIIMAIWWWRQDAPLKRRSTSIWLHGSISQKTLNFIVAAVRTWYLTNRFSYGFTDPNYAFWTISTILGTHSDHKDINWRPCEWLLTILRRYFNS